MLQNIDLHTVLVALGLTFIAGAATGLGSLMAFVTKKTDTRLLATALGLSAGVMIYVSFMELLPQAISDFGASHHEGRWPEMMAAIAFFAGIALIAIIDALVPSDENPHEAHRVEELASGRGTDHLRRTGYMVALAIGIHNFPEGIATFVSALDSLDVAVPIVIAIGIHNIPEGIATAVPIYYATGNRAKALKWSAVAGLAEPLGALAALLLVMPFWTPALNAWCLAGVAGIMVYISIDELLPSAENYGHHHHSIAGFIAGMAIMAVSLLMF